MNFSGISNEYMIYGMLFSVSNRVQTIGDMQIKKITIKQHFMLVAITMFEGEKPSLRQVAEVIGCSYQNVKRMATSLEKAGYLNIEQDMDDRRRLNLILTDKVEELSGEIRTDSEIFMKQLFKSIPKENLEITLNTLMRMEQNTKEFSKDNLEEVNDEK